MLKSIPAKLMSLIRFEKHKVLSVIVVLFLSVLLAFCGERVFSIYFGSEHITELFSLMSFYRAGILFFGIFFVLLHAIVKIKFFYDVIFRYRYLLAILLFVILVAGRINFSSIGMHDSYVQPGYGSEFTQPVFGRPRYIRTDEYVGKTPSQLASQFDPEPFGRFNYVMRGTATENALNGININFATIANPLHLFFLIDVEYGVSALWVGTLILTFMMAFELSYIISKKSRLLALTGACLITFSPFFQWWGYSSVITGGIGTIVCFYYFLNSESKIKRLLYSLGMAIFFSHFVIDIYPAWQVPIGFLYLGIAAWIICENRERVKHLGKFDYGIIGLMVILIAAVVATYLMSVREYLTAISNTVYPGDRRESGGGLALGYIVNRWVNGGVYGPLSGFRTVVHEPYRNTCEFGGFYTLFPVPMLFVSIMMIKKRVFDLLSAILIAFTLFIGSYIYIGWPDFLARITLMSNAVPRRTLDIVLLAQALLLIRSMSLFSKEKDADKQTTDRHLQSKKKIAFIKLTGAIAVGACLTFISLFFVSRTFIEPVNNIYFLFVFIGFVLVTYCLFDFGQSRKVFILACIYMIGISSITLMSINPVMRGLDAIYSKPVSAKISQLAVSTDDKWVSLTFEGPALLIANGASTINSTNIYPNLELWHRLDPNREYEFVYNRFAYISVVLTENDTSWFDLLHYDWIRVYLSYHDLETAGVKFIHTLYQLEENDIVTLTPVYDEGGTYIYAVS
jgi:hypothetical protein